MKSKTDCGDYSHEVLAEGMDRLNAALSPDEPLPTITRAIYDRLPPQLRRLCDAMEDDTERAVFLANALPIYAGCLVNVQVRCHEGDLWLCLYMIVFGVAGAGKGALRLARRLGRVIDERLYSTSQDEIRRWKSMKETGALPEDAAEPAPRALFCAGNASSAALADALVANGGRVVVAESELSIMAVAGKQDWGSNNANTYLQGFHSEDIAGQRKSGSYRITNPVINFTATATDSAVRAFIPSAESGLLSRFMFYQIDPPSVWLSQAPTERNFERDGRITDAAHWLDALHLILSARPADCPLLVHLTPGQWQQHDDHFAKELARLNATGTPRSMEASVKRAGINAFRIASTLAVLRRADEVDLGAVESITPNDDDVTNGIELATIFLRHAIAFAATLPTDGDASTGLTALQQGWLAALPTEFKTADAVAEGERRGISDRTVKSWLPALVKTRTVLDKVAYGVYRKRQPMKTVPPVAPSVAADVVTTDTNEVPTPDALTVPARNGKSKVAGVIQ